MYRTIAASFWTDPKVKKLSSDGKLLLLYLITNPHTHVSGIYILNLKHAALEIGWGINTLSRNLDTLSSLGFCRVDDTLDVIWVRKMMEYQGRGDKNARSAAAHIQEDLHNSFLCKEFLDTYPAVKALVKPSFIDTLVDTPSIGYPSLALPIPDPDPDPDPDQEQDICASYGEFQSVQLKASEHAKLLVKLNGNLGAYIDRLDRYSQSHPAKFRKYKSHYAVILNWFDSDLQQGRVPGNRNRPTGVVL